MHTFLSSNLWALQMLGKLTIQKDSKTESLIVGQLWKIFGIFTDFESNMKNNSSKMFELLHNLLGILVPYKLKKTN